MTPVLAHLQSKYPDLHLPAEQQSLPGNFKTYIRTLDDKFYNQLVVDHPVLYLEYSILCHQIRHNLLHPQQINSDEFAEQLDSALKFSELLEHLYLHYLNVPREVIRLRRHQKVYKKLLSKDAQQIFSADNSQEIPVKIGLSISQYIRDTTAQTNWVRLFLTRFKRLLNFIEVVGTNSEAYGNFIELLDKYTNPFFAYLAWCFFIPRLFTNLILTAKHVIPGSWMTEEEKSLKWYVRLQGQIQRRWFELANDLAWVAAGLVNCFILIGVLSPWAIYVTLFAFAFDVANAGMRMHVELRRLYQLKKEYSEMLNTQEPEDNKKAVKNYIDHINQRLNFEKCRLGLNFAGTMAIFLAMCLAIPSLAVNPIFPLIGAALLVLIWIVTYVLTKAIESYRPSDNIEIEKSANASQTGFFATKTNQNKAMLIAEDESDLSEKVKPSFSGG